MGRNIIARKKGSLSRKRVMIRPKKLGIHHQNQVMKKLKKSFMIKIIESLLKSMDMLTFSIFRFCPRLKRSSSWLSRERKCKKIAGIMGKIILLLRLVNACKSFRRILSWGRYRRSWRKNMLLRLMIAEWDRAKCHLLRRKKDFSLKKMLFILCFLILGSIISTI